MRPYRDADLPALLDLWEASWRATYPEIDFADRRDWFAGHLASLRAASAQVCCAEGGGVVTGFITIDPATNDIDQLAIAPAHFGNGLGALLMAQARKSSPTRLTLKVNKDNARALRFYEREGFARIAEGVNPQSGRAYWEMEWRRAQDA